jgi:hypothetical protein
MRDGTLARQISPVFLADAPGAVRVDGLHRSHVVQGLISQGLSRHTHTHSSAGSPPWHGTRTYISRYVHTPHT